jgi:small conductance mechanosensitive channel
MADPSPDTLLKQTEAAFSGDPEMLRALAATAGAFCVRLLVAGVILAVTLWLGRRLSEAARGGVSRMHRRQHPEDQTLETLVGALVKYLVIAIGLIAVLQQLGVQATSVLAVLGAASLAIGLALQGTLSNVAAGIMILLLRPYRTGDRVELNGRQGVVKGMDLFNTELLDYDGLTLYLPNGKVFGEMIVNITQAGRRRIDLTFGIDYEDDVDIALRLLTEIAAAHPRVLKDPQPWSAVTALADSSVSVTLRCWAKPDDWQDAKFDIVKTVKTTFEANGLSFPYPHQVSIERRGPPVEADVAEAAP